MIKFGRLSRYQTATSVNVDTGGRLLIAGVGRRGVSCRDLNAAREA
jgi:hypothetical protein